MERSEHGFDPSEQKTIRPKKLLKEEVVSRLESGENFENVVLADLNLAGLDFENKSFRGSDIRGLSLYDERQDEEGTTIFEIRTNIKGADFTDATIADLGSGTYFGKTNAEGAVFGYTESLLVRRERHHESGKAPTAEDTGGLHRFNGRDGNFKKTTWTNADFGGNTGGFEAFFSGADFSEATLEECDLAGIDFSETNIDGIRIIEPVSLFELRINENQVESLVQAIQWADQEEQAAFLKEKNEKGSQKVLEEQFQIVVVKA